MKEILGRQVPTNNKGAEAVRVIDMPKIKIHTIHLNKESTNTKMMVSLRGVRTREILKLLLIRSFLPLRKYKHLKFINDRYRK